MDGFIKKNDLGVDIEYTIVGTYEDDDGTKYIIYTDFVEDDTYPINLRLYVGKSIDDGIVDIDENLKEYIVSQMSQLIGEKIGV